MSRTASSARVPRVTTWKQKRMASGTTARRAPTWSVTRTARALGPVRLQAAFDLDQDALRQGHLVHRRPLVLSRCAGVVRPAACRRCDGRRSRSGSTTRPRARPLPPCRCSRFPAQRVVSEHARGPGRRRPGRRRRPPCPRSRRRGGRCPGSRPASVRRGTTGSGRLVQHHAPLLAGHELVEHGGKTSSGGVAQEAQAGAAREEVVDQAVQGCAVAAQRRGEVQSFAGGEDRESVVTQGAVDQDGVAGPRLAPARRGGRRATRRCRRW